MKRPWLAAAFLFALSFLGAAPIFAQQLTIGDYVIVSSKRLSRTEFEYTYKASVTNTGEGVNNVTATLTSGVAIMTVLEGTLSFGNVAAGAKVQSVDTFTVRVNRTSPVGSDAFIWNIAGDPATPLRARFSAVPPSGPAPLQVTFIPDPITTAAVISYEWDLNGDGTFERRDTVGGNVSFSYTQPGSYAVKLRVTDNTGRQDTQTLNLVVANAPPVITGQAQPSNGQVPLTVSFTATATDNEGIALYEWDFQGDGTFDYSSPTTPSTSHVYTTVGVFNPVLRVTDRLGVSATLAVPATTVRAAPVGSPTVTASASPTSGNTPLTVNFSGTASDPQNRGFATWEWDFEGDGTYDRSGATAAQQFIYSTAGTYFPRLRVTTNDGRTAEDVVQVTVRPVVSLRLSTDTMDPGLAETVTVTTTLGGQTRASVVIERRGGTLVRTLVPFTTRAGGTYNDVWDGKDNSGAVAAEGEYFAVLLYELNGQPQRLDLSLTAGGQQYNPPRTQIPNSFAPFAGVPLTVDFTLSRASEVTAFVGLFYTDTRLNTFLQRQPLGRGTHRITWNGENGEGQLIQPPPGDFFLFGIFGYTFPDNAIFVRSGVQLSTLSAAPSIFDPTGLDAAGNPEKSRISFSLSKSAAVELVVNDALSGTTLARLQYPGLAAGANVIQWDGKTNAGLLVAPGRYRLGLTAIEPNGHKSLTLYVLQRVFY